ncbi:hypothetical protein [Marinoscillum furvescens]|uniref:Uncharacterized protein n=1 Tax=Marinoscillum furvescens DSM 4134 TaxID=1122208 RepID=A0A3D9L6L7_MARFU|nr:hypothetical protein [Marinoscillum furvescens]REE01114.1 hypothetical protein C7460_104134 [Marinoscillum furvescens DSM 4134]
MKVHQTKALFLSVICIEGIHHQLGMSGNAVRSIRSRIRHQGQWPSINKMHEVLQLAGYTSVHHHTWIHQKQSSKIAYTRKKLHHLLTDPHFDQDLKDFLTPLLSED